MTPSLLDKQERDNANIKQNYIPPSAKELKTTDPEAWNAYVNEAVQYLNAMYPGSVTYDKAKDKYTFNNSVALANDQYRNAFYSYGIPENVAKAIDIIDEYNPSFFKGERTFDKRVAKQVAKDTKNMPLNPASVTSNIKTQVAEGVTEYKNTVKLTEDMSAYFIAAMRLLATKTKQQQAEQYYNAYLQYKKQLATTANTADLKFISDYLFTKAVQKAGANILDIPTLNAQRQWLSANSDKYENTNAKFTNVTGNRYDKNSGIDSVNEVIKLAGGNS